MHARHFSIRSERKIVAVKNAHCDVGLPNQFVGQFRPQSCPEDIELYDFRCIFGRRTDEEDPVAGIWNFCGWIEAPAR